MTFETACQEWIDRICREPGCYNAPAQGGVYAYCETCLYGKAVRADEAAIRAKKRKHLNAATRKG